MSMSGSKIREQVAHFLVDIHSLFYLVWIPNTNEMGISLKIGNSVVLIVIFGTN